MLEWSITNNDNVIKYLSILEGTTEESATPAPDGGEESKDAAEKTGEEAEVKEGDTTEDGNKEDGEKKDEEQGEKTEGKTFYKIPQLIYYCVINSNTIAFTQYFIHPII